MNNDKNGKKILITIGWLSAVLALGFFPLFLGIVAFCMGVVLKRDYENVRRSNWFYRRVDHQLCSLATLIVL